MKNRKICLILTVIFFLNFSFFIQNVTANSLITEEWYRTSGGSKDDHARGIALDSSDNIYVGGYTEHLENDFEKCYSFVRLIKYDNSGTVQWERTWNASQFDYCNGIALDSSGNVYLGGFTKWNSTMGSDMLLLKYNSSGELQWFRTWGGQYKDQCYDIKLDSSNNIYLVGRTDSFGAGGYDICLLKYNNLGELKWNRTWGGNSYDDCIAFTIDSLGNLYLVGITDTSGTGDLELDVCLLKYNNLGELQWNRTWGGEKRDIGSSVALDSSDNIYITGRTESFNSGKTDMILLKYNNQGELQLNETWGGSDWEFSHSIFIDSTGNIYIVGSTASYAEGGTNIVIVKYDNLARYQTYQMWGGTNSDNFYATATDSLKNLYFVGETSSYGAGGSDIILVKVLIASETTILGYDPIFLIGLVCLVSIILIKKRHKITR